MSNRCLICHKDINKNYVLAEYKICKNCFNRFKVIYKKIKILDKNALILYKYDSFLEEILVRLKGYKDIELASVFLLPLKKYLINKYKDCVIIPIPSSSKSNKIRGYNHVIEIFKVLDLRILDCFKKTKNIKQAHLNKFERLNIEKYISLDPSKLNKKQKYLLVDDVTTTNNSIRTCIKKLNDFQINNIEVLVIGGK